MGHLAAKSLEIPAQTGYFTLSEGSWPNASTSVKVSYTDSSTSDILFFNLAAGNTGRLGVGVASPDFTIDVSGDLEITGDLYVNDVLYVPPPTGLIIMWSGVSVPSGWSVCDGTNGTPNLINKFIIGAGDTYAIGDTGGTSTTVSGSTDGAHTHSLTTSQDLSHSHNATSNTAGNTTSHSHTVTLSSTGGHTHSFSLGSTTLNSSTTPSHSHKGSTGIFSGINSSASGNRTLSSNASFWETSVWISEGSTSSHNHPHTPTAIANHDHGTNTSSTAFVNLSHSHTASSSLGGFHSHTVTAASSGDHSHTIPDVTPPYYKLVYLMKL